MAIVFVFFVVRRGLAANGAVGVAALGVGVVSEVGYIRVGELAWTEFCQWHAREFLVVQQDVLEAFLADALLTDVALAAPVEPGEA